MSISSDRYKQALRIHGELSKVVAPATPSSIKASSGFTDNSVIIASTAAFFVGILLILCVEVGPYCLPDFCRFSTNASDFIGILGAALLGSAFYTMSKAAEFLTNKTYDPSYNQLYMIRLAVGICAGVILGMFGAEADNGINLQADLGERGLALVGSFAADALILILNRISETLVASVRGNEKNLAKANAEKAIAKNNLETANAIQEAMGKGDDEGKAALQDLLKKLMAPKT